jgi:hypothetical protein
VIRYIAILTFASIALFACKKTKNQDVVVEGTITDYRNGSGLSNVYLVLDEQVVSGGVLSGGFTTVAETSTSSDGAYALEFARSNALTYRVGIEKTGFFDREIDINPENVSPNNPYNLSVALVPEATVSVRLVNTSPVSNNDLIKFRYLSPNFNCECCTGELIQGEGMDVDFTSSCKLYGDSWIYYRWDIFKDTDTSFVDSVYCPAFQTTNILIEY